MIARALLAAALLVGCSSEPKCQGPHTICAELRSRQTCPDYTCSWSDAHCDGPASIDCHLVADQQACKAVTGCSWASLSGACTGTADCGAQPRAPACGTLPGCNWVPDRCRPQLSDPNWDCERISDHLTCAEVGCQWK